VRLDDVVVAVDGRGGGYDQLLKLLSMSLLVVIALSFHSVMEHVIKSYITENDLSSRNEVILRFAYPLAMVLLVWFIKVGTSSSSK
jgi:hypothetical protein